MSFHLRLMASATKEKKSWGLTPFLGPRHEKTIFGHMRTFAQSDQDLRCPLTESLATAECMNGEQSPG